MSDNDEHRELVAVWKSLNGIMDGLRQRVRWGDTEYVDVTDMPDRVRTRLPTRTHLLPR